MVINLIEWASCLNSLRGYAITAQYYADYEEIGNYTYENLVNNKIHINFG